jgi:eukaryotic-like serine/threonine-protein kinase
MALSVQSRFGPYEILSALGAGGMGEVYRARDIKLNRNVAIKVLPDIFARDPERLARLHREAQMLAALNHPNISHIYGLEDFDGVHALVMELVEGQTLAERIALGAIPLTEALPIAKQIAEALAAAHDQGIVHRDLKPANIKVREDGTVKVLDFGLARLAERDTNGAAALGVTQSPTLTTPAATLTGAILGTAAYMSPEQAKGRTADRRSDVWSFGAVFYEMLTGQRPFEGEDLADTLATVLKSDPDWHALPADVPQHVRVLIQRCLAKDRGHRIADISAAVFVMSEGASLTPAITASGPAAVTQASRWRRGAALAVAAMVAGAAVGVAVWIAMRPAETHVRRFALTPTGPAALVVDAQSIDIAIASDATRIVYKGASTAGPQLFVRALDQLEPVPLVFGGSPRAPFLSPDGQWIGHVDIAPLALKRVAISGGPSLQICPIDGPSRGASWGEDDTIVFATASPVTGLQRVSVAGGAATVLTKPDRARGESDHLFPQFLPGGQAVLFTITPTTGGVDASQIAVLDLRTGSQKMLLRGGSQARYLPSGHLVYAAAGTLRAIAFDLSRLEPVGSAASVVSRVVTLPTGVAEFDVARDGTLVYASGGGGITAASRTLTWVDRQGRETAIKAPARPYVVPRLSPDGTRIALAIADQENDIWVWHLASETLTRVTTDPGFDVSPVWMPDGRRIVFGSQSGGAVGGSIAWQAADGTGAAESLADGRNISGRPSAVSPDGTRLVFWEGSPTTANDVMMLTLGKDRQVQPLVRTPFLERNGEISPDGRWLAYESNESGQYQISVRPFADPNSGKWQVSTGGGTQPLWARNGQELFYLAPDGAVMSVPVTHGATWTAGAPARILEARYYYRGAGDNVSRGYDVSPDGKRFLMIKPASADQGTAQTSIIVVQNWFDELKRLVPVKGSRFFH